MSQRADASAGERKKKGTPVGSTALTGDVGGRVEGVAQVVHVVRELLDVVEERVGQLETRRSGVKRIS